MEDSYPSIIGALLLHEWQGLRKSPQRFTHLMSQFHSRPPAVSLLTETPVLPTPIQASGIPAVRLQRLGAKQLCFELRTNECGPMAKLIFL